MKGRVQSLAALALAALAVPRLVLAAAPSNFLQFSNMVVQFIDNATAVLIAGGVVIYFFGISTHMFKVGKGETSEMRTYLMWGLITIFVMVSIWGILQLLQHTLFGGGGYAGGSVGSAPTCNSFGTCVYGAP